MPKMHSSDHKLDSIGELSVKEDINVDGVR